MNILNTRTQILHIDTTNAKCTCVYDKIDKSTLEYLLEDPLANVVNDICGTPTVCKQIYFNEDYSIGLYKLPKDKGYLIQIFSLTIEN